MKVDAFAPTGAVLPSGKEKEAAASTPVVPSQAKAGAIPPPISADSINLSIPNIQSEKSVSALLSILLDEINSNQEMLSLKGDVANFPSLAKEGEFLRSLFYKGEEPLLFLKDFLSRSGLFYESKIKKNDIKGVDDDLKGVMLRLLERSGAGSEKGKAALELLDGIEARQLLNLKAKDNGALYLQIPMMLPNGPFTVDAYLKRDRRERDDRYREESYRIGFSMELSEAGLFSMDAVINKNDVSIRVQAENPEFLEFVRSRLPELSDRLSAYGMRTVVG